MLLVPLAVQADDDPVLFTVADMPVTRSEFEQSYLKNTTVSRAGRLSVADYLELYIDYKLKVKAALEAHLDESSSFKSELAKSLAAQSALPDAQSAEIGANFSHFDVYERLKGARRTDEVICPAQILILLPQKASRDEQRQAQQRIEQIYRELQRGADFGQMARQYSQDKVSAQEGGMMGWYLRGQMFKEVEDATFALRKGEMSRPFLSTIGYHIFLMTDRKTVGELIALRDYLSKESKRQQTHHQISQKRLAGDVVSQTVVEEEDVRVPSADVQKEYFEGLLLIEQSKHSVGRYAAEDEEALKYYFKKNKKKYRRKGFKPKDYTEVRELVVADLQEEMNKHWVDDLRKLYPVKVNKKVLKTVNNHH